MWCTGNYGTPETCASAGGEMLEERKDVRDPRVHTGACPTRVGNDPDHDQDDHDPAQDLRQHALTPCLLVDRIAHRMPNVAWLKRCIARWKQRTPGQREDRAKT